MNKSNQLTPWSLVDSPRISSPRFPPQLDVMPDWANIPASDHFVQFYEDESFLMQSVADFVAAGLRQSGSALIIATPAHREGIFERLRRHGLDLQTSEASGQLLLLDAAVTLSQIIRDGSPDPKLFDQNVGQLVSQATTNGRHLRAFGEMVALLWKQGNAEAAIRLEQLWNELSKKHAFSLFCAYPAAGFCSEAHAKPFTHICDAHSRVIPGRIHTSHSNSLPQDRSQALRPEITQRLELERALARRERELSAFLETATEGIHQVDPSGKILWANHAELNLLGFSADEYIGHDIREFHADPDVISDILNRLAQGETIHDREARVRHKDGSIRYVSLSSSMFRDGDKLLYSRCFSRDITKRKAVEQELRSAQQQNLADLEDIRLLYEISSQCTRLGAQSADCLESILDVAVSITGAAKGHIQLLDPGSDKLIVAAQRGFETPFVQFLDRLADEQAASCALAKRTCQRIVVEDVTKSPIFQGQPALQLLLAAGVRAVQSTPLVSSAGTLLGMISTHFAAPHDIAERELRLMDLLSRQAADYLERKRAGEGLGLLAAIVESSDDAIITKDLNGFITSWNKGAEQIFGYTADETVGKHISLLIPDDRLEEEPGILARLRSGQRIEHFETVRRRKDGKLLDISLTVSPVRDPHGQIIGASKIARDITELTRVREDLARSRQELEQRVAERTAGLEQAIVQMEDFTYSISHDLRAPARIIEGFANVALDEHGPSMPPDLRSILQKISDSAHRMEQMTRDILDYSRVERTDVKLTPVHLDPLVQRIIADNPSLQPPKATVQLQSPLIPVLGYESSLSQAITNLLANAVKFVPPGAHPGVQVWTERLNGSVRLCIKDNGVGIDPKHHHRLFRLFEPLHSRQQYEGTGVGLAIVRKAVEKMGGKVGLVSDGHSGCTFWIELISGGS